MTARRWGLGSMFAVVWCCACGGNAELSAASAGGATNQGGAGAPSAGAPSAGASSAGAPNAEGGAACTRNSECELLPRACCSCGTGPISDFVALNRSQHDAFIDQQCSSESSCAPCGSTSDALNVAERYYLATCEAGRCVAVDLTAQPITDCVTDADCRGRSGTSCCDECLNQAKIAINSVWELKLQAFVCGPETVNCRDCGRAKPPIGASTAARCTEGKCELVGLCNQCM